MSYRVEYHSSGNKFWKLIFAPFSLLVLIARIIGIVPVIHNGDCRGPYLHVNLKGEKDE